MRRWKVETRAIVRRTYFVDGEDEKEAEAESCNADADIDEEENEETMNVTEIEWHEPVPPRDWLDNNERADFIPSKGWRRYIRWIWYGI